MTDKTSQIFMSDCSLLYPQQLPVATCQLAGNWEGGGLMVGMHRISGRIILPLYIQY